MSHSVHVRSVWTLQLSDEHVEASFIIFEIVSMVKLFTINNLIASLEKSNMYLGNI